MDSSPFGLIIELLPEEKREKFEKLFEKHKHIQDEEDPLYVMVLTLFIFMKTLKRLDSDLTGKFKNFSEEVSGKVEEYDNKINKLPELMFREMNILKNWQREKRKSNIAIYLAILIISFLAGIGTMNMVSFMSSRERIDSLAVNGKPHSKAVDMNSINKKLKAKLGK